MADQHPPWTVKGASPELREAINAAARRADMTVAQWLEQATRLTLQAERSGVTVADDVAVVTPAARLSSVDVVERIAAVLTTLGGDGRGNRRLSGLARRVLSQHLQSLLLEASRPPQRLLE